MARGRHQSVPKELKKEIKWLEDNGVKVILGLCECARHKFPPGKIKVLREMDGGLKANGYSGNGIINIFLRCKNETIKNKLLKRYSD